MAVDASLIVVSYNKRPYTALCLESVLQSDPIPGKIIVVDNGSEDGSVEYLADQFAPLADRSGVRFDLVRNHANVGACTARNQGLERVEGRFVGFLDNDTAVRSRDWLATLARVLAEETNAGIVGPKLLYPFEPFNIEHAGAAISPHGRPKYLGRGRPRTDPAHNRRRDVQCLISAAWLMKRDVPDAIGGLDEVFNPAQFEDFDFCYRARGHGFRVLYEPSAELYHFENVTTDGSVDVNFRYVTIKNGMTFKKRWRAVFASEGGPPDRECGWEDLPTYPLEVTGVPPLI